MHFKSDYDYFKYRGKTRVNWNSFEKFSGKRILHNILKEHEKDFKEFIATGFAYNYDISWVGDFSNQSIDECWLKHQKNMQSITRTFTNEVSELFEDNTLKDIFIGGSDLPLIEKKRIDGSVSLETCVILDNIFDYINTNKCIHPLWDRVYVVKKYSPFLDINLSKFKSLLKNMI